MQGNANQNRDDEMNTTQAMQAAGNKNSGNPNAAENLTDEDRSKGGSMSGGNFKNDPERAREAGRKGGSK